MTNPVPPSQGTILRENGVIRAVDSITFRPNTGEFFAYQDQGNLVYNVDVTSGALTQVAQGSGTNMAGQPIGTTSRFIGFDFNNALDAARIVSVNDENLVFFPQDSMNPSTGALRDSSVIRATDLFYVPTDPNRDEDPTVFGIAYSNAVPQAQVNASTQQLYALDSDLDILATLNNSSGELGTLGRLVVDGIALDFTDIGGFDILSPSSDDNLGLALLNVGGQSNLYSFQLPPAGTMADIAATYVSTFGKGFSGFAVAFNGQPAQPAPIPLPAAGFLLAGAMGGLAVLRRRRPRAD